MTVILLKKHKTYTELGVICNNSKIEYKLTLLVNDFINYRDIPMKAIKKIY